MSDPLVSLLIAALLAIAGWFLFRPERGLIPRWRRARQLSERIRIEDALKHIHDREMNGDRFTVQSLAGVLQISVDDAADLLVDMESRGLLRMEAEGIIDIGSSITHRLPLDEVTEALEMLRTKRGDPERIVIEMDG